MDAALDLSHTQNIGYVLKNHFAKSQFLVVRLPSAVSMMDVMAKAGDMT